MEDGVAVGGLVGVSEGTGVSLAAIVDVAESDGPVVGLAIGVVEVHAATSRARAGRAAKKWTLGLEAEVGLRRMMDLLKGRKCNRQPPSCSTP